MQRVLVLGAFFAMVVASLVAVSAAGADGLPVLGIDAGGTGVVAPSDGSRYVTIPAGGNTVVAQLKTSTGTVVHSNLLPGTFTIPAVAYDGSAGGLSHDGTTLVLIEPRTSFPRANTPLLVLDTNTLRPKRLVRLHGDFSFDAVSPTGTWIYLINYLSPSDPTRYAVRALNTTSGRLAVRPVLDPRAPDEKMRGNPLSRVMSPDGRWAYTLYDGAGGTPFVHALDTAARSAHCIDLDALTGAADLWSMRLGFDQRGERLRIVRGRKTLALVDLRTFTATGPSTSAAASSLAVELGAGCAVAVAAFSLLWFRRRRLAQSRSSTRPRRISPSPKALR